jgi:hypothetical protein
MAKGPRLLVHGLFQKTKGLFPKTKGLIPKTKGLIPKTNGLSLESKPLRLESKRLFVERERLLRDRTAHSRTTMERSEVNLAAPIYLSGKGAISSDVGERFSEPEWGAGAATSLTGERSAKRSSRRTTFLVGQTPSTRTSGKYPPIRCKSPTSLV